MGTDARKRLVILGSGFAAISLLKRINLKEYDVTVVSPRNHFLFTPLLPSTTIGTIEFRSIVEPIRKVRDGDRFVQASCTAIDPDGRTVTCRATEKDSVFTLPYDMLLISVGAWNNTFGVPGVREHAFFLKELSDARSIRERLISCLEAADVPGTSPEERARLLHFAVVGGGPTGVEFAAELHDLIVEDLENHYEGLEGEVRVTLFEAGPSILNAFDENLREYTVEHFGRNDIEVRLETQVSAVRPDGLQLRNGEFVPAGVIVWSTGNGPTGLIGSLPFSKDRSGRILTNEYLQIPAHPEIYAAGDCATPAGAGLPQTAQVAMQQGKYLARELNRMARGRAVKPFHFNNLGMLAYVGEHRALADIPRANVHGHGLFTYFFWRSAYLTRLVSLKNKALVLSNWIITALFGRDLSKF
ncbi:MAG TPA: FAD-dependent oxidoreductase [Candidatus Kapabacteria bacterium]|nr:FAD-dependent oxidoreductase [Candidatus Kapabacteria bacterium]